MMNLLRQKPKHYQNYDSFSGDDLMDSMQPKQADYLSRIQHSVQSTRNHTELANGVSGEPFGSNGPPQHVHLLFLCHGNHGCEIDFQKVHQMLQKSYRQETWDMLISVANANDTHKGVEEGGWRQANELLGYIRTKYERHYSSGLKIHLYYVCHSLGGLYARAALKYLAKSNEWKTRVICPRSYISLCSPHLGSQRPGGNFKKILWRIVAHTYACFLGRTGDDLFLKNDQLWKMSYQDEYIVPLKQFEKLTLVSISHFDMAVPYASSAIRSHNPYKQPKRGRHVQHDMQIVGFSGFSDERYVKLMMNANPDAIVTDSETIAREFRPYKVHSTLDMHSDSARHVKFSRKMLYNLNMLPWRRLDVQFTVRSVIDQFKVHELVLAKQKLKRLYTETMIAKGRVFVEGFLSQLIWYDRVHSRDFMKDFWRDDPLQLQDCVIVCAP